jgi:predicted GIY-YIG superfamily endonuclease
MEHLYRHFDKSGALLYVGISLSAIQRLGQHKDNAHWFCQITRVEIENYPTRAEARDAEKKAISSENPLHNLYRPTVKEQKAAYQESKDDIIKRIVQFNPTYSPEEVAHILGMQTREIRQALDNGSLGYIEVEGRRSGPWPVKMKKRITGWQLIDYLEHLEHRHKGHNA